MAILVRKQIQSRGAVGAASQLKNGSSLSANLTISASAVQKTVPTTNEVSKEVSVTLSLSATKKDPAAVAQSTTIQNSTEIKRALALTAFKLNFVAVANQIIPLANAAKLDLDTAKVARQELVDWSQKYNNFFK